MPSAQAETDIQRDYIFAAADINPCPLKLLLPSEVMFLWERYWRWRKAARRPHVSFFPFSGASSFTATLLEFSSRYFDFFLWFHTLHGFSSVTISFLKYRVDLKITEILPEQHSLYLWWVTTEDKAVLACSLLHRNCVYKQPFVWLF